jgi:ATP-dependent Clp protease ATP-binding subunit ClpA
MNFEIYTERARGFVQSAQALALREGHQQFTTEHLLKVLLDDEEGLAANLIRSAGGDPKLAQSSVEAALRRLPKVEGSGAGQVYLSPQLARVFDAAEKAAEKAGDRFVTAERLLFALALDSSTEAGKALKTAGLTPQSLERAIQDLRKGRTADSASAEQAYDALKRYARGQARSRDRARRGDTAHDSGAGAAYQEQSGAHRRTGRRQDGDRRGFGATHRQWRRSREPQEQEPHGARYGCADCRRQIPRRI